MVRVKLELRGVNIILVGSSHIPRDTGPTLPCVSPGVCVIVGISRDQRHGRRYALYWMPVYSFIVNQHQMRWLCRLVSCRLGHRGRPSARHSVSIPPIVQSLRTSHVYTALHSKLAYLLHSKLWIFPSCTVRTKEPISRYNLWSDTVQVTIVVEVDPNTVYWVAESCL